MVASNLIVISNCFVVVYVAVVAVFVFCCSCCCFICLCCVLCCKLVPFFSYLQLLLCSKSQILLIEFVFQEKEAAFVIELVYISVIRF